MRAVIPGRRRRLGPTPPGLPSRLVAGAAVAMALLLALLAPAAGAQTLPGPANGDTPATGHDGGPVTGERPVTEAPADPGGPPRPRQRPSGALNPYKQVSIPGTAATDVVFDDAGHVVVAGGTALHRYLAPGLYVGSIDLGGPISGLTMAGGDVFVSRSGLGTERRDPDTLALQATYPQVAGLTDQAVTGDQLLFTTADGNFGRLSLSNGAAQVFAPPAGTARAFYALAGTTIAIGVTTAPARVIRYDLAPAAPSTPTVVAAVDLLDGAEQVDVLALAADNASVLVRVGAGTARRISLSLAGTAGGDLGGTYGGPLAAAVTGGNGGWELLVSSGTPGSVTLFERNAGSGLSGSIAAGLAAAAWNVQGTEFATVSPAGPGAATAMLRLYTPPGEPRPATAFSGADGEYTGITPTRVADTRDGGTPLGPGAAGEVQVGGIGSIPATGVLAVAVNLTVVAPSEATYLAAYPSGEARPFVSNVNAAAGQTTPNLAIVRVGAGGRITLFNAAGHAHVVADVVGYFAGAGGTAGGRFHPLTPARLLDSRDGTALGSGELRALAVRGRGGVPAGATAVALTVTAVAPGADTFITVFPSDRLRPFSSNLNPVAGRTVANLVFSRIGADGNIALYNEAGRTDLIVDVVGYWDELRTSEAGRYVPFQRPFRYYDSRLQDGPVQPAFLRSLRLAGFPASSPMIPLPDDGAMAVAYNLTATNTTAAGYLTAFPGTIGTVPPPTSNLNFAAGQTAASLAVTGYGADGEISVFNPAGSTDVVIDVAGFFTSASF